MYLQLFSYVTFLIFIIVHKSNAHIRDDALLPNNAIKSFWFNYINQTLNILQQTIDYEMIPQNNKISNVCNKHLMEFLSDARKGEHWANKMIDSMGRPSSGVLEVGLSFMGYYSECIKAIGPNYSGKYCLATVTLPESVSNFLGILSDLPASSFAKTPIKIGTCFPSSCSLKDITTIVNRISSNFIHNSSASISKCYEENANNIKNDVSSLFVIALLAILLLLVTVGTVCDHIQPVTDSRIELLGRNNVESNPPKYVYNKSDTNSILFQLLIAFSIKENANKIFDTKCSDNSIQVFHGIRFLSMVWIIGGHSVAFAAQWINFRNLNEIREVPQSLISQILANGTFSVDCFFFISGFLVSYLVLKEMKNSGGKLNLTLFYIHRYLRMTPSMMAVIAFSATLLQYIGEGPQWSDSIIMFNSWCKQNWWINSLYLHNFINTNNMCLSHSWYSAVDMQLYVISPLILIPLYLKPILGLTLVAIFLIVSMSITSILTILNHYPAVPYFNDLIPQEIVDQYYGSIYIKPYCRIGPYLVGIVLAYAIYTSQGDIKMKKMYSIMGWIISFMVSLGVLFAMLPANNGNIPEVHIAALYSATSRTIWSLSLAWITFACITGHGGIVSWFLSWKVWIPLSRLTHCAYLVHPIVMAAFYGTRQHTFDFSNYLLTYFIISHIFMTYIISFIISLLVESPFIAIAKLVMKRKT